MEAEEPKMELTLLNPMVFYPRFPHIPEQIFKYLDNQSLKNCRVVSKSWQECIDDRDILWNKVFKNKDCNKTFQLSCQNGLSKIVEFLMKKSIEFKIDLNAKGKHDKTVFHWACKYGHFKVAEMCVQKSLSGKLI